MAALVLPEAGILLESLEGDSSKLRAAPKALGLTLTNTMIEDMIRCVQNNKSIQLCLGEAPKINYGSKTQHLSKSRDSFHHDLIKTTFNEPISPTSTPEDTASMFRPAIRDKKTLPKSSNLLLGHLGLTQYVRAPNAPTAASSQAKKVSETAGADVALAALQNSLASEAARKQENSTEILNDALTLPNQRKGGAITNKSKPFPQKNRSIPSSPAFTGYSSPMPASQKEAEEAKIARKPVIHLLALNPLTEVALRDAVVLTKEQLKVALNKVADRNDSTARWELKRNYWKELDPWTYDFAKPEQRQIVIDNAVRQYDKLRLARSDPEWERLLPKEERGTGKCLSKLQASIALGTIQRAPKINVQKPEGDNTPRREVNESKQGKTNGDMAKSGAQAPRKAKAVPKAAAQASSKSTVKSTAKVSVTSKTKKPLSSEFAHSDDDEDEIPPPPKLKPMPKDVATTKGNGIKRSRDDDLDSSDQTHPKKVKKEALKSNGLSQHGKISKQHPRKDESSSQRSSLIKKPKKENQPTQRTSTPAKTLKAAKRGREEDDEGGEGGTSSSSDMPLSKKIKKNVPPSHRTSEISQLTTNSSIRSKVTSTNTSSPHRSSLVASSPPTHAPEIDRSYDRTSSDSDHQVKRHRKSSPTASSTTSSTDSGRRLTNDALLEAKKFKLYYVRYEKLYRELQGMAEIDKDKLTNLLEMHERLKDLKEKIYAGVLESQA